MLWRRVCATARADLGFSGRPKCFARPRRYVTPGVHGSVMDGCRRSCEISAVHCGGAAAAPECAERLLNACTLPAAERLGAALPSCVIRHIRVGGTTKGTGVSKTGREWRGHPTSRAAADQQQSPAAIRARARPHEPTSETVHPTGAARPCAVRRLARRRVHLGSFVNK